MTTVTLSGVYSDPTGKPLPYTTVKFESQQNSSQTYVALSSQFTTGKEGEYSIALVPNTYLVTCRTATSESILGFIDIYSDSPDGTLNEYLTSFKPEQATPGILAEMQEILEETKEVAAGAGVVPCGAYDETRQYDVNDLVEFDGSEYRATASVIGISPPSAPWELFLSAGADGKDGENGADGSDGKDGKDGEIGPAGPANEISIGTVTTLPAGSEAVVTITGDSPSQVINFEIPKGDTGDAGEAGKTGDAGPANILSIGVVDTLPAGSDATAEITGDSPNQILNLGIPQGEKGDDGSAGSGGVTLESLYVPNTVGNVIAGIIRSVDTEWGSTIAGSDIKAGCFSTVESGKIYVDTSTSFLPAGTWSVCGASISPADLGTTSYVDNLTVLVRIA